MIASLISVITGEFIDGLVIILIIILNICIGVYQENKSNNIFAALKKMSQPVVNAIRNGQNKKILTQDIVPGDLIILSTGDKIPADIRLTESYHLMINESSLTGESSLVEKNSEIILDSERKTNLADRTNCVYAGTIVASGHGKGIVFATGMSTEIGKIADELNNYTEQLTPLQSKLKQFSKVLSIICLIVCVLIFLLGLLHGDNLLEIFMTAISLAVAAIPEGLTVVITVLLALGMQNMSKSNVIIKKLSAVETLGGTTVICSDKTGTLTQNKMSVVKIFTNSSIINFDQNVLEAQNELNKKQIEKLFEVAVLCNDAEYENGKQLGDPTESCLLEAAYKIDIDKKKLAAIYKRKDEISFDSKRKIMSTINARDASNDYMIMNTKGAPDEILKRTKFILLDGKIKKISDDDKNKIIETNDDFANHAYRVLAFAFKKLDYNHLAKEQSFIEDDLIFVGLICIIDPPRKEIKNAIRKCKSAGIKVKMITGDHKKTAIAIAKELKIISDENETIDGIGLDALSDSELKNYINNLKVFARVTPEHKVRLIKILKHSKSDIVAMTGDGVNDAPALKNADIGIAMGITGTDVAKEAADMILVDDNFANIVKAIEEGRKIYINIKKVIAYLLSCNMGEILLIFLAMVFNLPLPLKPIHLLSINLITDALPAFSLGFEQIESNVMNDAPNDPQANLIDQRMIKFIAIQSLALGLSTLICFIIILYNFNYQTALTCCFVTLVIGELLRVYSSRSNKRYITQINFFSNRFLNVSTCISLIFLLCLLYVTPLSSIFFLTRLNFFVWLICILFAFVPTISGEIFKFYVRKLDK